MLCFWARGYEGSSIRWLTDRMHLPRASLYQRFGDKRGLFLASVDYYSDTRTKVVTANLSANGNAAAEIGSFFDAMIDLVCGNPKTKGCLIACVLTDAAGTNRQFREILRRKLEILEEKIFDCLSADKNIASSEQLHSTAAMLAATARGLALAARAEIPAETLRATARFTVKLACP